MSLIRETSQLGKYELYKINKTLSNKFINKVMVIYLF